jgi:DNA-binding transcriptional MerR regulator
MDQFLGVGEVAARLGVGPQRVRQLSDRGILPCIRGPYRARLFRPAGVEAFARRREGKSAKGGRACP